MHSADLHQNDAIAEARELFQRNLPLPHGHPVRPDILRSWERSRTADVNPHASGAHYLPPKLFSEICSFNTDLMETAIPAIDLFHTSIQGSQTNMLLTDVHGVVLYSVGEGTGFNGNPACTLRGFSVSETNDGTTAMGLCLIEKKTVYVTGAEHYKHIFDNWHCTAAPIMDTTNTLLGTVACVINRKDQHLHTLGMITAAANVIAEQLKLRQLVRNHQTILELLNEAVIVLDSDCRIKEINPYACKLFGTTTSAVGKSITTVIYNESDITQFFAKPHISDFDATFTLTNGAQLHCNLSASRTSDGGLIINLRERKRLQHYAKRFIATTAKFTFDDILGDSPAMQHVKELSLAASPNAASVLILGESGVGKELFAQAIHNSSPRSNGPFIAINCGAIPRDLIQSELFGYEPGAFTGASREGMLGKFEMADGGTLFLDEIGDMALNVQVNLLRVLQEGTVTRVGGKITREVDVRVIAATHRNLASAVEMGAFRRDLYYRLNVFSIKIPPLRERVSDISLLARFFLEKYQAAVQKHITGFTPEVMEYLESYFWPGNVRELENVIERATIIARHPVIRKEDLPLELLARIPPTTRYSHHFTSEPSPHVTTRHLGLPSAILAQSNLLHSSSNNLPLTTEHSAKLRQSMLREQEAHTIMHTLTTTNGNMRAAAKLLGISRGTLYTRLRQYGIEPQSLRH